MSNKKTLKMTKRNSKRGKSRKGGFLGLFKDKHNEQNPQCNPNNLVNLKDSQEMFANYKQCCPKSWYGRKNNSPYCKQLDLNYKAASQERQMETNANLQMLKTTQFQVDDDGTISTIDCKNPELYNSEKDIQRYIKICECSKSRWNPFSKKKENCGIVKKRLDDIINEPILKEQIYQEQQLEEQKRIKQEERIEFEKRIKEQKRQHAINLFIRRYPLEIYGYTEFELRQDPRGVKLRIVDKDAYFKKFMDDYPPEDYRYTEDELRKDPEGVKKIVEDIEENMQRIDLVSDSGNETEELSDEDEDEKFSNIDYRNHQILTGNKHPPAYVYGYGGKRRITKKHFRKRSIGKRSIGKRSIGKRKQKKHSRKH